MMKKWICIAMSLVLFLGPALPTAAVAASADSTGAAEAAAEKQEPFGVRNGKNEGGIPALGRTGEHPAVRRRDCGLAMTDKL